MDILIASNNKDKIAEIRLIFQLPDVNLRTLDEFPGAPEVIEDGNSLYENALKKASVLAEFTGMPTISDDTALEVDALNGKLGIFSARYAGPKATYKDNVEKIIKDLSAIPEKDRKARFRTVAVFYHLEMVISEEGIAEGFILTECRGKGGFGYDPIFFVPEKGKTYAEMSDDEKNSISHRSKAFRKLHKSIKNTFFTRKQ
ncbi:MAG: non-canonical purine NTP pyrophosphatase, RdgB/HAM1 family [Candidatus Neomarinimicrobiota bacterium]|nr:MAG: non-canonical purine NTP pyrophosphatase, RdgB/HAM1 family [Candidatus Neomarinimicrobiota bacterium]